jgi:hypothetical protein
MLADTTHVSYLSFVFQFVNAYSSSFSFIGVGVSIVG